MILRFVMFKVVSWKKNKRKIFNWCKRWEHIRPFSNNFNSYITFEWELLSRLLPMKNIQKTYPKRATLNYQNFIGIWIKVIILYFIIQNDRALDFVKYYQGRGLHWQMSWDNSHPLQCQLCYKLNTNPYKYLRRLMYTCS